MVTRPEPRSRASTSAAAVWGIQAHRRLKSRPPSQGMEAAMRPGCACTGSCTAVSAY